MEKPSNKLSAAHTVLVMSRAVAAIMKQGEADLQRCQLSSTDFRILEALLHKGALSVNVIGPKVHLTPGAISVAIDRLEQRKLVTRAEGERDRRVRTVALTKQGEKVIVPVYRRHAALLEQILSPLSREDRCALERMMKLVGKYAETLSVPADGF